MSLDNFPVLCYGPGCQAPMTHKIAARWSDGVTHEWKTYYLCCRQCLPRLFRLACEKQARCPLVTGETLDRPTILAWRRGQPLLPCPELVAELS